MKIGTKIKGIVSKDDAERFNSKDFTEKKCTLTGKLYNQIQCPYCNKLH